MEAVLNALLSYLISVAAGLRTNEISQKKEEQLEKATTRANRKSIALTSTRTLKDEISKSCIALAKAMHINGVPSNEKAIWNLLTNEDFQNEITEWIITGNLDEGERTKTNILELMEAALRGSENSETHIQNIRDNYFELIDRTMHSNQYLASWRHQLGIEHLKEQVAILKQHAEEAAGKYSIQKRRESLKRYCEYALESWDIIDLSNLPEGDIHMATQQLLLRQLYMPLRITIEGEGDESLLTIEEKRDNLRRIQAGHTDYEHLDMPSNSTRHSIGERLEASRKLVVLGDPGGGKTTMLRWLATAYLLKIRKDPAYNKLPDISTLPDKKWIPVLIRCRDLGRDDLCRCFKDFLTQHLHKNKLLPEDADIMLALILEGLAKGEVLLLIDGLDEITDSQVRMTFCQEIENTVARYPKAHIVVTSRIVGYRDMPYRMKSGFEHGVISELDSADKDLFAHRWVDVTEQKQSSEEKQKRAEELLEALHSSDRIERLTGNPMLLTTLALVKRKVGKLPNKRTKLYNEAVSVLLNWNPRLYKAIEEDEAIPQLEYLAYEMCKLGVQRLYQDQVLDLLEKLRAEYPNIRPIKHRSPEDFLAHLEARSSIIIKSGGVWNKETSKEKPVWEFRHLTFQEYLAARALLDGRYSNRDKSKSLAEQVSPLAGDVKPRTSNDYENNEEVDVPESWREALRLLVADCKDDDVDEVLIAIATPLENEEASQTARPRAVLAALCLVDEPNVSEETAVKIICNFTENMNDNDGESYGFSNLDKAAMDLNKSSWSSHLKSNLAQKYYEKPASSRASRGAMLATLLELSYEGSNYPTEEDFEVLVKNLNSENRHEAVTAAITIMALAYDNKLTKLADGLIESLLMLTMKSDARAPAAGWALVWLSSAWGRRENITTWNPNDKEMDLILETFKSTPNEEYDLKRYLLGLISLTPTKQNILTALSNVENPYPEISEAAIFCLGRIGDQSAISKLIETLNSEISAICIASIRSLTALKATQAAEQILEKIYSPDQDIAGAAINALGILEYREATAPLLSLLQTKKNNSHIIIDTLSKIGNTETADFFIKELEDNSSSYSKSSLITALKELKDPRTAEQARKLTNGSDYVSVIAASVLIELSESDGLRKLAEHLFTKVPDDVKDFALYRIFEHLSKTEKILLSKNFDELPPFVNPFEKVDSTRITLAANTLKMTYTEVEKSYEAIRRRLTQESPTSLSTEDVNK